MTVQAERARQDVEAMLQDGPLSVIAVWVSSSTARQLLTLGFPELGGRAERGGGTAMPHRRGHRVLGGSGLRLSSPGLCLPASRLRLLRLLRPPPKIDAESTTRGIGATPSSAAGSPCCKQTRY